MINNYLTSRHTGIFPLVFLFMMLLFVGCQKERSEPEPLPYPFNKLPLPTQTGENTFGCLINGEPWVAYAPWNPFGGRFQAAYDEDHYGLDYNRRLWQFVLRQIPSNDLMNDSISSSFTFDIRPITNTGHYDKMNLEYFTIRHSVSNPGSSKIYALDTLAPFHIHITKLDTVKKIVSGTFEMDMRRISDSLDVLQIRHGRFDALYQKE